MNSNYAGEPVEPKAETRVMLVTAHETDEEAAVNYLTVIDWLEFESGVIFPDNEAPEVFMVEYFWVEPNTFENPGLCDMINKVAYVYGNKLHLATDSFHDNI